MCFIISVNLRQNSTYGNSGVVPFSANLGDKINAPISFTPLATGPSLLCELINTYRIQNDVSIMVRELQVMYILFGGVVCRKF